jgi:hypothetical protein
VERMVEVGLAVLAVLGFVGWLGGGRKWAFRTLLSALLLVVLGAAGIFLYGFVTDKVAEHRAQQIHACAVAKIANPHCDPVPKNGNFPAGAEICPAYSLDDDASPEQEDAALVLAEEECRSENNPQNKSLHEQIVQYRRDHGIVEKASGEKTGETGPWMKYQKKGDVFDQVATENAAKKLSPKACATKVRTFYPGVYDDLDDATLAKKVLAKYPTYCDVTSAPPDFIPDIKNIR